MHILYEPTILLLDIFGGSCFCLVTKPFLTLWPRRLYSATFLCPWDFSGRNTGVGCYAFLQGIFLTQGSNLHLLHQQTGSLPLSHQKSPEYPFLIKTELLLASHSISLHPRWRSSPSVVTLVTPGPAEMPLYQRRLLTFSAYYQPPKMYSLTFLPGRSHLDQSSETPFLQPTS